MCTKFKLKWKHILNNFTRVHQLWRQWSQRPAQCQSGGRTSWRMNGMKYRLIARQIPSLTSSSHCVCSAVSGSATGRPVTRAGTTIWTSPATTTHRWAAGWDSPSLHLSTCSQVCQLGLDWFLPRDAERKRGLCCFLNPAAPSFQFFWSQATIPSSKENPFIGRGVKYTGVGIKFRLKSPFISETLRDMLIWLLYNVNRKSPVADRYVSVPVTLSDLERRDARGQISLITLVLFDLDRPGTAG